MVAIKSQIPHAFPWEFQNCFGESPLGASSIRNAHSKTFQNPLSACMKGLIIIWDDLAPLGHPFESQGAIEGTNPREQTEHQTQIFAENPRPKIV